MNVTEAVDSLSAMFHPGEQLTQPLLPVSYLHITTLCLYRSRCGNRIAWSSLCKVTSLWGWGWGRGDL